MNVPLAANSIQTELVTPTLLPSSSHIGGRALLRPGAFHRGRALSEAGEPHFLRGTERLDDRKRHREIGKFIDSDECVFPGAVILAANYDDKLGVLDLEDPRRWSVEVDVNGVHWLVIPTNECVVSIVDGQHRLHGFVHALRDAGEVEMPCSIFFDLPNPLQAYLFAVVNFNQKKVDRSLAFELFGFDTDEASAEQWPPDKLGVFLCRKLNSDAESAFGGHIRVAAQDARTLLGQQSEAARSWLVSTATIVDGIMRLISKKPQNDRNIMFRDGRRRSRSALQNDGAPLREIYLAGNDLLIYTIVRNFFSAVDRTFWRKIPDGAQSYIFRTVGIQALFDVLSRLVEDCLKERDASVAFFERRLASASRVQFNDKFFQASGVGRLRIRNMLFRAIWQDDQSVLAKVSSDDYADYQSILAQAGVDIQDYSVR